MEIKVVSWNIAGGEQINQVVDALSRLDADVIGLQEVRQYLDEKENSAEIIAEKLGYHFIFYKAFTTDRHSPPFHHGNAILCKLPLEKNLCHFLSMMDQYEKSAETEPRIAIEAEANGLTFINTHLAYSKDRKDSEMRTQQLEKLLPLIQKPKTIVMGDFNSLPDTKLITQLNSLLKNTDANPIQSTKFTKDENGKVTAEYHIDYIFVSKDIVVKEFKVIDAEGSDHKPILTVLEV